MKVNYLEPNMHIIEMHAESFLAASGVEALQLDEWEIVNETW